MEADKQTLPKWWYREQCFKGVDWTDTAQAGRYDAKHSEFRDFEKESMDIISALDLSQDSTVIDLGAGTGNHTVYLARECKRVIAVDISESMLACCREKCQQNGLNNVKYHVGGFLTYQHDSILVDAVVSNMVLHHLPDMWKQLALIRCFDMLKPDGRLYLMDVVFSFQPRHADQELGQWVQWLGPEHEGQAAIHVRDEYSTMDWIMEGLLYAAGFDIEWSEMSEQFIRKYLCTKRNTVRK